MLESRLDTVLSSYSLADLLQLTSDFNAHKVDHVFYIVPNGSFTFVY